MIKAFGFLFLVSLILLSESSRAGLFQVTNRNYGTAPASAKPGIDQVFNQLEDLVNANLPNANQSTYLKAIADSSALSGAGVGVDYATDFRIFVVGASAGVGANLGGANLFDLINNKVQPNQVTGLAAQDSLVLGIRARALSQGKLAGIELDRLKLFLNFFSSSFTLKSLRSSFTAYGLNAEYKILPPRSAGLGLAKWNGLDLTTGLRFSSMQLEINQTVNKSYAQTVSAPGNPTITANFNGTLKVGADVSTTVLPLEVSTSARLLHILTPYFGLGTDFALGSANSIANLSGPLTATDSSGLMGTIGGTGVLDLGQKASPHFADFRYFLGTQLELGVVGVFAQFNESLSGKTTGLSVGLRAFW